MNALFNQYLKGDRYIWWAVIMLSVVGLLAVYSSTGTLAFSKQDGKTEYYMIRHGGFLVFGFVLMYFFHRIDFRYFSRFAQIMIWLAIPLLLLTIFLGNDINEAKRTLTIPFVGISFQTSDFARLALVMFIARYLSKNQEKLNDWKPFLRLIFVIGLTCVLIFPENLSTSLVLAATSIVLLFIGNVRLKHLLALILFFVVVLFSGGALLLNTPDSMLPEGRARTWKSRTENFLGGEDKDAYQTIQAKIAIANGGLLGKGPGRSTQKNTLPHPYSDFIFAIIIEEYGILGGAVVMGLFILIFFRSILMVNKSPRAFGALLAVGLSFTMVSQSLIHMAVATTLFPVTGLTLPLISMGGTSLIFTSLAFGIILSVSRTIEESEEGGEGLAASTS